MRLRGLMLVFLTAAALVSCGGGGGSDGSGAYSVNYDGNGSTGGAVPVDPTAYAQGDSVTVLDNTGSLVKPGYCFAGWNTEAGGSGTKRIPSTTFALSSSSITLYAKWIQDVPKKIMFIHHSSGGNWLATGNGNLGAVLNANNYYLTESDYGWDAEPGDDLGDHTDTVDWPLWFNETKMPYVYANNFHSAYANAIANPGGENEIVMFKSCFPNSEVGAGIGDEKALYNSLLPYFAAHPDKLFVLVTPPGETSVASYQLTRELCDWLVDTEHGWLSGYAGKNVMVFDFYMVLSEINSHHRRINGVTQHTYDPEYNGISPYHDGDDHPNAVGNQKASQEFINLLNYYYYCVFKD